jgi:isoleucyl-tRNA synthetase
VHLVDSAGAVEAASAPAHRLAADRAESGCTVAVARAAGRKCDRCWFYHETPPAGPGPDDICPRCATVVAAAPAPVA